MHGSESVKFASYCVTVILGDVCGRLYIERIWRFTGWLYTHLQL